MRMRQYHLSRIQLEQQRIQLFALIHSRAPGVAAAHYVSSSFSLSSINVSQ